VARFDVLSAWMCRHSSPVSCQSLFRLFGVFGPIVFPSIFFLSVSSFLGSITNAHHHFMGFAFSHALVSMATVFFFYTLSFFSKNYGLLFSWSILLATATQTIFMIIECGSKNVFPGLKMPSLTKEMRYFISRFFLGLLSVSPLHIGTLVTFWLATKMPIGSLSLLNYADRVVQLPTTLVGLSLGAVLLPAISDKVKANKPTEANMLLKSALSFACLIIFPVAIFIYCFAPLIVDTLFGHSKITQPQLVKIVQIITIYCSALPAIIFNRIVVTRFFAQGHMWAPFICNIFAVTTEASIAILTVNQWHQNAIPLSVSAGMWVNIVILFILIYKEYSWNVISALGASVGLLCINSGLLFMFLKGITTLFSMPLQASFLIKTGYLIAMALACGTFFVCLLLLTRQTSLNELKSFLIPDQKKHL
jgi:putative peptidoglycan lipid II flippase